MRASPRPTGPRARRLQIAAAVLPGRTLESVGTDYGISRDCMRQLVMGALRAAHPAELSAAQNDALRRKTRLINVLRERKEVFLGSA